VVSGVIWRAVEGKVHRGLLLRGGEERQEKEGKEEGNEGRGEGRGMRGGERGMIMREDLGPCLPRPPPPP